MNDLDERLEAQRLRILYETGLLGSRALPELEHVCQRARERFGVPTALVTLVDRERLIVIAPQDSASNDLPRSEAFCDVTIRADDVFVVSDMLRNPNFLSNPLVKGDAAIRFYAGAPLTYLRNIRLGALCLLDTQARGFSLGDRAELATMADEVVSLIARLEFPEILNLPKQK